MPSVLIDAPPVTPPRFGLIDSAIQVQPTDLHWENGIEFLPEVCSDPESWANPCVGPSSPAGPGAAITDGTEPGIADLIQLTPYLIRAPYKCTAYQWRAVNHEARATRILNAGQSKAMETELYSGLVAGEAALPGQGNPQLTDSNTFTAGPINGGTATASRLALISLVQAASEASGGGRAMIHATPATVQSWWQSGSLIKEGNLLVTGGGGHIVVSGSGYPGLGPDNAARTDPAHHWAWVTSPVHYLLGEIEPIGPLSEIMDRKTNDIEAIAQRAVAVYWDLCLHVGINVDTMSALD